MINSDNAAGGRRPSVQAEVYATALRGWHGASTWKVWRTVCDVDGTCSAGATTQPLRDDLRTLLGSAVTFVGDSENSISLQSVQVDGDRAVAQIQEGCGRGCFEGQRAHYKRTADGWRQYGEMSGWAT